MTDASRYPRVLVVAANTFVRSEGGGTLLSDLFEGWPASKLASIYRLQVGEPDSTVCGRAYQLYPRPTRSPYEWARRSWDYVRGVNESLDGFVSMRMTRSLLDWLQAFDPELVYSFLGPLSLSRLTNGIVDRFKVPLAIHIHDDYVTDWPVCGIPERDIFPVADLLNRWNRREFLRAARRARLRLSVSDAMSETYRRRYGLEFVPVPKGAELPDDTERRARGLQQSRPASPLRIFYGGTVLPNTNRSALLEVANAIRRLRARGIDCELVLACSSQGRARLSELHDQAYVRFIPLVPQAQVPDLLQEQDILLLPFNFDEGSVRFIRYSWPTKIPEYMLSRVPILVYGPMEAAFVRSAATREWALVVDRRDGSVLEQAIEQLTADANLRRKLVATADEIGRREHDIRVVRADFQRAILTAASAPAGSWRGRN